MRSLAAHQWFSASLIAGLFCSTARVTSPNESWDEVAPSSPPLAAIRFRIDKDVANKIKKVVVFILSKTAVEDQTCQRMGTPRASASLDQMRKVQSSGSRGGESAGNVRSVLVTERSSVN